MLNKKAQEEIVGFVAIIVIVSLIVVFLIGYSLRNNDQTNERSSVEIKQFIESSAHYTTDCDIGLREKYADMSQIVENCYKNPQLTCKDGRNACKVYNETMHSLLASSWAIGNEQLVKGYALNVSYEIQKSIDNVLYYKNGVCEENYKEEEVLSPDSLSGTFVTKLRICF